MSDKKIDIEICKTLETKYEMKICLNEIRQKEETIIIFNNIVLFLVFSFFIVILVNLMRCK